MMRRNLKVGDVFRSDKLPKGDYVVEETAMTGGGTGHGPYDIYPDGHRVTARRLNRDGTYNSRNRQVEFYQTGSFSGMIEPKHIERVGLMKRTFVKKV